MKPWRGYQRPVTLLEGVEYLLREKNTLNGELANQKVIFINYCSCPAFLIVNDGCNKIRCPRGEIFEQSFE
jgi:hypothetical protein